MYKTGANCPLSSFLDAIFAVTSGKPGALYVGTTQPSSEQLPKTKEIFDEHIFDFVFKNSYYYQFKEGINLYLPTSTLHFTPCQKTA